MKVLLVPNDYPQTLESARLLASRLVIAGLDVSIQPPGNLDAPIVGIDEISLVVPMGGDGTFLAAARLIDFAPIPLLGFNYGRLGFLCGNPERDEVELIGDCLCGDVPLEHRSTLDIVLENEDGDRIERTALNEFTYARGGIGHMVEYSYAVNGTRIAQLRADGLVAATATGSTAYALSAGGPILSPDYNGMVVVPIAPHTLNTRALVLAPSDVLELTTRGRMRHEASIFVDGVDVQMEGLTRVTARRGGREVLFARGGAGFFTNVAGTFFGEPVHLV